MNPKQRKNNQVIPMFTGTRGLTVFCPYPILILISDSFTKALIILMKPKPTTLVDKAYFE